MSTKILDCTNVDELPQRLADAQADIDKRIGDLEWERDATLPALADLTKARLRDEPVYALPTGKRTAWLLRALDHYSDTGFERVYILSLGGATWAVATSPHQMHAIKLQEAIPVGSYRQDAGWLLQEAIPVGSYRQANGWLFGREDRTELAAKIQEIIARMDGKPAHPLPPATHGDWPGFSWDDTRMTGWRMNGDKLVAGHPGDGPAWVGQRRVVEDALALGDAPLMHSLGRDEKWPAEWWQLHLLYGDAFAILMQVKPDWRDDLRWEAQP